MKKKQLFIDFIFLVIGSLIYATSVNAFTAPNNIAPGGLTGLATLINYVFHTPIGTVALILNIPLVIWAVVAIGYKIVLKSIVGIFTSSIIIDLMALVVPAYHGDGILIAIFAGLLEGTGLGLIFIRGATTGGTDIIANILSRKKKHLSIGKIMLIADAFVIAISAVVFKSIESAMYACIVVFISTKVIDAILYGSDIGTGKMFFIFSTKSAEMAEGIFKATERGVTFLKSTGAYSGKDRDVVFCAVRRFEVYKIHEVIKEVDKNAFVVVGDAGEISGEGFKSRKSDDKTLKELLELVKKNEGDKIVSK